MTEQGMSGLAKTSYWDDLLDILNIFNPRRIYKEEWLRFLFWFNTTWIMGGRAYAGERVRQVQRVRLIACFFMIAAYLLTLFSPIGWLISAATLVMWVAITVNFFVLPMHSSGNTVKIQIYYDAEWELQLLNNEKLFMEQEPPHGLLHSHSAQRNMLLLRYGHDGNGALGTAGSTLSTLCDFFVAVANFISPLTAASLLLFARISAAVSATGAPLTYQKRLSVHTQNINDQITTYYDACLMKTPDTHAKVQAIINNVFMKYPIEQDKYYNWLKFRCYRAVERAIIDGAAIDIIENTVEQHLQTVCDSHGRINKISRNKLRNITPGCQKYAVLDALPIFEQQLYQALKCPKISTDEETVFSNLHNVFTQTQDGYGEAFVSYFKSEWLKKHGNFNALKIHDTAKWTDLLKQHLTDFVDIGHPHGDFKKEALKAKWPIETSHGNQLLPTHQIKKIAEFFVEKCSDETAPVEIKAQSEEQQARDIWRAAVQDTGDTLPEGQYNDHDPLFHGVMTFAMQFLIQALKKNLNKFVLESHLKKALKDITEESSVKKFFGFAYKSFNLKKLKTHPDMYQTPWLQEASKVKSYFIGAGRIG